MFLHKVYNCLAVTIIPALTCRDGHMTIDQLGSIGEVIGGIAVVASLIALIFQMRQNTKAVRAASVQAANLSIGNTIALVGQNPENADVFYRGLMLPDELSESETVHFTALLTGVFVNCDAMYWDHRSGILPYEVWEREISVLKFYSGNPGGKRVWSFVAENMVSKPFAKYVEANIIDSGEV